MKFTLMTLLYGLLVGMFASPPSTSQLRPTAIKHLPEMTAMTACVNEPLAEPQPAREEVATSSNRDLKPISPPERSVTINESPRRWVLSDKTWRSINESLVNVDVCLDRGQEYIGVRIVLPFGS